MRFPQSSKAISILAVTFLVAAVAAQSPKHQRCHAGGNVDDQPGGG